MFILRSQRQREKTQSRNTKDNKARNRALGFSFGAVAVLLVLLLLIPSVLAITTSGNMQLGDVDISVQMTSSAYNDGAIVQDANPNSGFYVGGKEIDAFQVVLTVSASGDFVDWSTLSINPEIYAEVSGQRSKLATLESMGTSLSKTAGGYSGSVSYMVESLETYLSGSADEILDDGTKVFYFVLSVDLISTIDDARGNHLIDTTTVRTEWQIQDGPGGVSADIGSSEIPKFTTKPVPLSLNTEGTSLILEWTGADDNPDLYQITTYTIYDGSRIAVSGTWTNESKLRYDVDTFRSVEPGDYEVSVACKILDGNGQSAISTVLVRVTVPTAPATNPIYFEKMASSTTPTEPGPCELSLTFKPRSDNPSSYQVFKNGVVLNEGAWSGGDITVFVSYLYPGENLFKCVVFDTAGYSATYSHTITTSTDIRREIDPRTDINVNSPFGLSGLSVGLWVSVGVLVLAAGVYLFRWWRNE